MAKPRESVEAMLRDDKHNLDDILDAMQRERQRRCEDDSKDTGGSQAKQPDTPKLLEEERRAVEAADNIAVISNNYTLSHRFDSPLPPTRRPVLEADSPFYDILSYFAPTDLASLPNQPVYVNDRSTECVLCMCELTFGTLVSPNGCNHVMHRACFEQVKGVVQTCPECSVEKHCDDNPTCPSGFMEVGFTKERCDGFAKTSCGTYVAMFEIHSGVQESYHPSPGKPFDGVKVEVFIPETTKGTDLLNRVKWAWARGLLFQVNKPRRSKHHTVSLTLTALKTTMSHERRDPVYLSQCNAQLDSMGVPQIICDKSIPFLTIYKDSKETKNVKKKEHRKN